MPRYLPMADGTDPLVEMLSCRWIGCSRPATGYRVCDGHFELTLARATIYARTA